MALITLRLHGIITALGVPTAPRLRSERAYAKSGLRGGLRVASESDERGDPTSHRSNVRVRFQRITLTPALSRLRERGFLAPSSLRGEDWGEEQLGFTTWAWVCPWVAAGMKVRRNPGKPTVVVAVRAVLLRADFLQPLLRGGEAGHQLKGAAILGFGFGHTPGALKDKT